MSQRWIWLLAASLVTLLVLASLDSGGRGRMKNVIVYVIDTCRADHLSLYGYERDTTPFLRSLAERSRVFDRAYANAPWTKESVASMLTSKYPSEVGVHELFDLLAEAETTWPEELSRAGYYVAGFSANPVVGPMLSNFGQGFDEFHEAFEVLPSADVFGHASGSARRLNEKVLPWLEQNRDRPFALYVHAVDPHAEYQPAREHLVAFADVELEGEYRQKWNALRETRLSPVGYRFTERNFGSADVEPSSFIDYGQRLYDADIRAADAELRKLWEKLVELGLSDDLILVVTSDHGEEFLEHGATSHGYGLYDELLHVPLLIYGAGPGFAGKRVTEAVSLVDLYPTLLEAVGLAAPEGVRGHSLLSSSADRPGEQYAEHRATPHARRGGFGSGVAVSLRSGRWKLVSNLEPPIDQPRSPVELFDLNVDPAEQQNVAGRHPGVAARLRERALRLAGDNLVRAGENGAKVDDGVLATELGRLGYYDYGEGVATRGEQRGEF